MGLASELVCNPPSPASEVPHGSLRASGQRRDAAAADRESREAGQERRREGVRTDTQECGCGAHPERHGINKPALPRL